ncbi:MAG TPA: hypothetical protein VJ850_11815 [Candidatus Limnocylindrales bacterium]|nr:hypothetical protein [Candidatus Limnocylindrales bacterium]
MDEEPQGGQPVPPAADEVVPPAIDTASAAAVEPPPPSPPPAVAPPFGLRVLLKDTFARYGADWRRLMLVSVAVSALTLVLQLVELGRSGMGFPIDPSKIAPPNLTSALAYAVIQIIVGVVSLSVMLALIGGGREMPLRTAFMTGLRRSPRAFVVLLAIVLVVFGLTIVAFILAAVLGLLIRSPFIGFVLAIFAMLWVYGYAFRLSLAVTGVVIDDLRVGEAWRVARWVTRGRRIWVRLIGSAIVIWLAIAAASFSVGLLELSDNVAVVVITTLVSAAFVGPFFACLVVSWYRRLVPPGGFRPSSDPTTASFTEPVFGEGARRLLGVTLVLAAIGIVSFPTTWQRMWDRLGAFIPYTTPGASGAGRMVPGAVVFGATSTPSLCAVATPKSTFSHTESFTWVAAVLPPVGPTDNVQLRATRDGVVLGVIDEPSGSFFCLYPSERESGFVPGTYLYEILVNGQVRASGTVTIT